MHRIPVQADLLSSVKQANPQQILIKFKTNNHRLKMEEDTPNPEQNCS